jgi:hypothetical protein
MNESRESFSEAECEAEFGRLFPNGLSGPDVQGEIAFDKIADWNPADDPAENSRNVAELLGRCVWDIFSNEHEVIAPDGRLIDLGSFRGSGEFIADYLNRCKGRREWDYMDFYLGTGAPWSLAQAGLGSVYELIFRRLHRRGLNWVYHFPRLHLVDFRPLREALDREGTPNWADYSPSEALAKEEEQRKRDEETAAFRERLEEGRNEEIEEALKQAPPAVVEAYRIVYGHWPEGWPPTPGV